MSSVRQVIQKLPESPGVYIFKNSKRAILYIGKAVNLRRRVLSYFQRSHDARIEKLIVEIKKVDYKKTDSALEALILEAQLIKKYKPPYNIAQKDDKSFLYVEITREKFPRLLLVRGKEINNKDTRHLNRPSQQALGRIQDTLFGPFISGSNLREALRILRKIFPWSTHAPEIVGKIKRPCFEAQIGLCPGTCVGAISRAEYIKTIGHIRLFFQGKKKRLIGELGKEMGAAGKTLDFELAGKLKRQIFALKHIQDTALLSEGNFQFSISNFQTRVKRIEGYDVSNISGTSAVGAMVVFQNGESDKKQYRKFKIQSISAPNDVGMLQEVMERRLRHLEWPLPDMILIDGGKGQVNVAERVLAESGLKIPIVGIAKGPKRKRNDFYGEVPEWTDEALMIKVRNEAHRFAISYHKKLRSRASLTN